MKPARLAGLVLLCLLLLPLAVRADTPVLRVLAWPGYADADVVRAFEIRQHATVQVTLVDSDEALWDKMHDAHGSLYDVVAANTVEIQRYVRAGLLQAIDPARIPNIARQQPRFRDPGAIAGIYDGGQRYAVPFTYSSMGLIYDRRQVAEPPRSMAELWNPRYRGKVLAHNSAQHNFSFTALALGLSSPFKLSEAELRTVALQLVDTRRNLLGYYNLPEEATELFLRHKAALMFANYGTQQLTLLRQAGADVGYAIPGEGALAWLDCWAVTRSAHDGGLAAAWINYMLEPEVNRILSERQGLANTLIGGVAQADQGNLVWLQPVEDVRQRETLWARIVAGDRPGTFR